MWRRRKKKNKELILLSRRSLERPSWTQYDLYAYKHKHPLQRKQSDPDYIKNYFINQ